MPDTTPDLDRMTLEELQKFLADELSNPEGVSDFSRAFTPLTDGLGLLSPVAVTSKPPPPKTPAFFDTDPIPAKPVAAQQVSPPDDELQPTEKLAAAESLTSLLQEANAVLPTPRVRAPLPIPEVSTAVPPPVPIATLGRRFLAGVLDETFVLGLWVVALVITSSAMNGHLVGSGSALSKEFSQPLFVRFAALEFAMLWLGYFALSIGILDMTLGMWAWSLRVKYLTKGGQSQWPRRILRIVMSFVFFAPVAPVLLLLPRWKGRNLLDFLTGSALYRVMA